MKKIPYSFEPTEIKNVNKKFFKMITTDSQSFWVDLDKGFLRFSHALNIKYKFLLQNITEKHFPELYSVVQRRLKIYYHQCVVQRLKGQPWHWWHWEILTPAL